MEQAEDLQRPVIHSTCSINGGTRRNRRSSDSNSPEFEFCMLRNPSFPQPNLLSADELFSGGVLLPLYLLRLDDPPKQPAQHPLPSGSDKPGPGPEPEPSSTDLANFSASNSFTSSKRWKDIFKKSDKKKSKSKSLNNENAVDNNINEKNKEKKRGGASTNCVKNRVGTAELNVNLWPFSRSRSAGNNGSRLRMAAGSSAKAAARKVSSAPCSRSNSAGESKTARKWPSSPSRSGLHLGRSSPVLHVRRGCTGGSGRRTSTSASGGGGEKSGAFNFNVPVCTGYRHHLSCGSDENSTVRVAAATGGGGGRRLGGGSGLGARGSRIFNIRSMFTKKVY